MTGAINRQRQLQTTRSQQAKMLKDFKESTTESYDYVLEKNLESINRVPVIVADDRVLGKFKEM